MATTLFNREIMWHEDQSREGVLEPNRPLVYPRSIMKIGNWNARTLNRSGNFAQAGREMTSRGIEFMGISETNWIGQRRVQLAEGETIIYSGRDNNIYRKRVGILL